MKKTICFFPHYLRLEVLRIRHLVTSIVLHWLLLLLWNIYLYNFYNWLEMKRKRNTSITHETALKKWRNSYQILAKVSYLFQRREHVFSLTIWDWKFILLSAPSPFCNNVFSHFEKFYSTRLWLWNIFIYNFYNWLTTKPERNNSIIQKEASFRTNKRIAYNSKSFISAKKTICFLPQYSRVELNFILCAFAI